MVLLAEKIFSMKISIDRNFPRTQWSNGSGFICAFLLVVCRWCLGGAGGVFFCLGGVGGAGGAGGAGGVFFGDAFVAYCGCSVGAARLCSIERRIRMKFSIDWNWFQENRAHGS